LQLAQECVDLGARVRTLQQLTRLTHRELVRLFFTDPQAIPRGRPPDSPEWYHTANALFRAEASLFGVLYAKLRHGKFAPTDALVSGYRHYRGMCDGEARISFDRAFDLASHLDGIWIASVKSFAIATCPRCDSGHLVAVGGVAAQAEGCPFCKILRRYQTDPRVQMSFPAPPLVDPAQVVLGIDLLLGRDLAGGGDIPQETPA